MKKRFAILMLAAVFTTTVTAQILKPVKWQFNTKQISEGIYDIECKATIDATWHLYDTKLPEGGPLSTSFNLDEDETSGIELVGNFKATSTPKTEHSQAFDMELRFFTNSVTFVQRIKVTKPEANLVGFIEFMACTGGQCTPPTEADFKFVLKK